MKFLLLSLFLLPLCVYSQTNNASRQEPFIDVMGSAEKEITPNIIVVKFVLKEINDKNKVAIEEQEKNIIAALKANGFDSKNLVIRNANAQLLRQKKRTTEVQNQKEYSMTVSSGEQAYKLFHLLDDNKVFSASIAETSHTEIESLRKEVKQMAMKAAKEKAKYLLESIDEKLGKPIQIVEIENAYGAPMAFSNIALPREREDMNVNDEYIDIKPLKIRYQINAKFAIE